MKYLLVATALVTLAACKEESTVDSNTVRQYTVECIDGVEYWRRTARHSGYMAVRVDPETMTFVRCEVK
jgi:hypothetical protein